MCFTGPSNKPTIFFGNEFLDALPIKQFINFKGSWYERYIQKNKGIFNFTKVKCNIEKVEKKSLIFLFGILFGNED